MKLNIRSLYIDENTNYSPYVGYSIDVELDSFDDLSEVISHVGEESLLDEMDIKTISDYVTVDDFLNSHKIEDIIEGNEEYFLSYLLGKTESTFLLDYISDDTILSKAREITIDKI